MTNHYPPPPPREGVGGGGHASMTFGILGRVAITAFFCLFVLFLYGPTLTIVILSFQGPDGGLTFPMNGVSLHWFARLFETQAVGDFGGALTRSLLLAVIVMVATVVISLAAGLAFRRRFIGANALFTLTIASLIIPSILVSLGVGLLFNLTGLDPAWYSSALGAQLTWTLPFGLLIMFAVFNRFNRAWEEAALRSRRLAVAAVPPRRAADHRAECGRRRAVRLHPVLRRIRSHAADGRQ